MVIVTGGAGFIGSCVVRTLNDAGIDDIMVVDHIASTNKWMNLRNKRYVTYVHKREFLEKLHSYSHISAVIHLGAQSSTTETDFDYLWQNNVEYSKTLWDYCTEHQIPLLYASSAATYGDGSQGFDDTASIHRLLPLNGYGYSKQAFDLWAESQIATGNTPSQHVGLKFFNVYGPNEYFKGSMASMVYHGFKQVQELGKIRLFKSCRPDYADGGQLRDFVYVKDVCEVILWMLEHPSINGIFNVGTGSAQSFAQLAESVFAALDRPACIEYIEMPEHLREKYQYYTQATLEKLRSAGYTRPFQTIQQGAADYVQNYLAKGYAIY